MKNLFMNNNAFTLKDLDNMLRSPVFQQTINYLEATTFINNAKTHPCLSRSYSNVRNGISTTIDFRKFIAFLGLTNSVHIGIYFYLENGNLNIAFRHEGQQNYFIVNDRNLNLDNTKDILNPEPCSDTRYNTFTRQTVLNDLNALSHQNPDRIETFIAFHNNNLNTVSYFFDNTGTVIQYRDLNITCPPTCPMD